MIKLKKIKLKNIHVHFSGFSLFYLDLFIFQDSKTLGTLEFSLLFPTPVSRVLGKHWLPSSKNIRALQLERGGHAKTDATTASPQTGVNSAELPGSDAWPAL